MSIKYRILFCVMVLCVAVPTMAQNIVKISGRVIDADNQPVELAIVRIAGTTTGTSTNLEGKYELKVASADTVKVIYSCLGYREEERILRNPSGEVRLEVQLQKKIIQLTRYCCYRVPPSTRYYANHRSQRLSFGTRCVRR